MSQYPDYITVKKDLIGAIRDAIPDVHVYLQGTMLATIPYPDTFVTMWNDDTYDGSHYDNNPLYYVWRFVVTVYSTDPETANTSLYAVRDQLKARGFICDGIGSDAYSDEDTHTGRSMSVLFMDYNKNPQEVYND